MTVLTFADVSKFASVNTADVFQFMISLNCFQLCFVIKVC